MIAIADAPVKPRLHNVETATRNFTLCSESAKRERRRTLRSVPVQVPVHGQALDIRSRAFPGMKVAAFALRRAIELEPRSDPMKRLNLVAVSILTLFSAAEANAGPVIFTAHLTGPNENPANNSAGIGDATVTFDLDSHTMAVSATFSGLTGVTMASHIHCCVAAPGGNAGVATQTPSFVGFPLGVTSGSFSTLLDMSLASSFNPAFVTANGNIANAEQVLFNGALNGTAYFNIHSSVFGGGEIRGFLVAVSEPATISALGFGLASLFLVRRRLRV